MEQNVHFPFGLVLNLIYLYCTYYHHKYIYIYICTNICRKGITHLICSWMAYYKAVKCRDCIEISCHE